MESVNKFQNILRRSWRIAFISITLQKEKKQIIIQSVLKILKEDLGCNQDQDVMDICQCRCFNFSKQKKIKTSINTVVLLILFISDHFNFNEQFISFKSKIALKSCCIDIINCENKI